MNYKKAKPNIRRLISKNCKCLLCGSTEHILIHEFDHPVENENTFGIKEYYRELWRCSICGLFFNEHDYNFEEIYKEDYRMAAYRGDLIHQRFIEIMNLPIEKSDNKNRVYRIQDFFKKHSSKLDKKILDIGSGMGVFPAAMKQNHWEVVAIDPDPINIEIAKNYGQVRAIQGVFPNLSIDEKFSLITFNKVIEHIPDATSFLNAAKKYLNKKGYVYIELPDGEEAIKVSHFRQEFFLEHYYAFTSASICLLADIAGFSVVSLQKIKDPSGKHTLAGFLKAENNF
jgi:SAM-dependent methyltransferase